MSSSTITNFIKPTSDVVSWAMTQLGTYTTWGVSRYPKIDYQEIFLYLLNLRSPFAVVVYTGSSYEDDTYRRTGSFAVIVGYKEMTDAQAAAVSAQTLLDKAIELLDHEMSGDLHCRVKYDKPIDFKNSGVVAYEVGFKFDDH